MLTRTLAAIIAVPAFAALAACAGSSGTTPTGASSQASGATAGPSSTPASTPAYDGQVAASIGAGPGRPLTTGTYTNESGYQERDVLNFYRPVHAAYNTDYDCSASPEGYAYYSPGLYAIPFTIHATYLTKSQPGDVMLGYITADAGPSNPFAVTGQNAYGNFDRTCFANGSVSQVSYGTTEIVKGLIGPATLAQLRAAQLTFGYFTTQSPPAKTITVPLAPLLPKGTLHG